MIWAGFSKIVKCSAEAVSSFPRGGFCSPRLWKCMNKCSKLRSSPANFREILFLSKVVNQPPATAKLGGKCSKSTVRWLKKKANKCPCHPDCSHDLYICHYYRHEGHAITSEPASPGSLGKHATIVQRYAKIKNKKRTTRGHFHR